MENPPTCSPTTLHRFWASSLKAIVSLFGWGTPNRSRITASDTGKQKNVLGCQFQNCTLLGLRTRLTRTFLCSCSHANKKSFQLTREACNRGCQDICLFQIALTGLGSVNETLNWQLCTSFGNMGCSTVWQWCRMHMKRSSRLHTVDSRASVSSTVKFST